jgi:hypothetical protein
VSSSEYLNALLDRHDEYCRELVDAGCGLNAASINRRQWNAYLQRAFKSIESGLIRAATLDEYSALELQLKYDRLVEQKWTAEVKRVTTELADRVLAERASNTP